MPRARRQMRRRKVARVAVGSAVMAGTAGAVHHHQQKRWDQQEYEQQQEMYEQQMEQEQYAPQNKRPLHLQPHLRMMWSRSSNA